MLTRLQVTGFKNLVGVDVHFGPFTCIAGSNGVGKSNLFDAIRFLSALSEMSLLEAAKEVRGGRTADVRELFHRVGDKYDEEMSFSAEMIVSRTGEDTLGQQAEASATFLRYTLQLAYRPDDNGLEIKREELGYIRKGEAMQKLMFGPTPEWLSSVFVGKRTVAFISTDTETEQTIIRLHQDRGGGSGGQAAPRLAHNLPRTVLQVANAAENRTAVIARQEMQSWRLLRLEPLALREPDEFNAPAQLSERGEHLPALLARLAQHNAERVYEAAANRLSELIDDVREVGIDRDEKRELLTLWAKGEDDTPHTARSLSEGTLRFLALAVLEQDPQSQGVLCLEEPENGIHPERIAAILNLLKDIAVDTQFAVGLDNPLRQVIVNTHSPSVVGQVQDADLVAAELQEQISNGQRFRSVVFRALPGTWRADGAEERDLMPRSRLIAYLNPFSKTKTEEAEPVTPANTSLQKAAPKPQRVVDRADMKQLVLLEFEK